MSRSCNAAQDVWNQASRPVQKLSLAGVTFKSIWEQMTDRLPKSVLEEVGMIARLFWSRRNEFMFGKEFRHPNSIVQKAKDDLGCFNTIKAKQNGPNVIATGCSLSAQRWKKPPDGHIK